MRDIGSLHRRLENVEYYTQLSLLESAAQNMQIQDSDGMDRFKNHWNSYFYPYST